jgi:hypothetical protein
VDGVTCEGEDTLHARRQPALALPLPSSCRLCFRIHGGEPAEVSLPGEASFPPLEAGVHFCF